MSEIANAKITSGRLLAIASITSHLDGEAVPSSVDSPDLASAGLMYDWRNHVPEGLREEWLRLSTETRLAVFAVREREARSEDCWD